MGKETTESERISLSFGMESGASLWNLVFEGFDQEVILVSRFSGVDADTVKALYRFGAMINETYKDCRVKPTRYGIEIRKTLPENDASLISEWTCLMENVRDEILKLMRTPPDEFPAKAC
jgi:hypothetical protein